MSNFTGKVGRRAVTLAAVSTLALGVTACGDDSTDNAKDNNASSSTSDSASRTYDYYMTTGKNNDKIGKVTGTPEKTDPKTPYDVVAIINPSTLLVRNQQGGDAFFVHMINTISGKAGNGPEYSLRSALPEMPAVTDEQIAAITDPENYGTVSAHRYAIAEALAEHGGVVYLEEDPTITEQAIKDSNDDKYGITNESGGVAFRAAYVWFSPDDERSGNFASSLNGIMLEKSNAKCSHPEMYGFQSEIWRAQTNLDEYDLSTEKCGEIPAYYEIGEPVHGRNVNKDASDIAKKRAAERGITDNWGDELWGLDMTEESYHLVGTKYRKQADELAKTAYDKYDKAVRSKQSTE